MYARSLKALLVAALCLPASAFAQVTLFQHDDFRGREVTIGDAAPDLVRLGFNDTASSIVVRSGAWEVCTDAGFRGECRVLERGEYRRLDGLNDRISSVRHAGGRDERGRGGRGRASLEMFSGPRLRGEPERLRRDVRDFVQIGYNDRAHSVRIDRGVWQLCSDADFRGTCRTFEPGIHELGRGLAGRVSSARVVDDRDGRYDGRDGYQPPYAGPRGPGSGRAAVELFGAPGFAGPAISLDRDVMTLEEMGFNDRAGSIVVNEGEWEFCEHEGQGGQCAVFGPGRYDRLGSLDRAITSMRRLR
ncbi:MAG TPA: beta/gamma crystallin-related protein [Telluria sp.]|nr:beta/gamma crystallin-related protein [Telluria sp.]